MKSTWERTTEFLHPYVSFLVSGIQTLREDIRNKQWSKAARYLYWFIPYLDPEIKEKLLKKCWKEPFLLAKTFSRKS